MSASRSRVFAITAGLSLPACLAAPCEAFAATVPGTDILPSQFVLPFAIGCACGACACGAVVTVSDVIRERRAGQEDPAASPGSTAVLATGLEVGVPRTAGRHGAGTDADVPASAAVGRHAARVPAAPGDARPQTATVTGQARAVAPVPVRHVTHARPQAAQRSAASAPAVQRSISSRIAPVDGANLVSDPNDYATVAENYVKKRTLRERMAARARGVADVLQERIGQDRFEGLPVIERADGSVGDVGTSWWNARLGDSVRRVGEQLEPSQVVAGSSERSAYITENVAAVDQGAFPERRSADELEGEDLWEIALRAMGEKIDETQEQEALPVGVPSHQDEDDEPTDFIPFRTPAGHPEVVDTRTYVDYLISDEFSRNRSQVARRSSREYLHVIEGGSQEIRSAGQLARPSRTGRYVPRHMAPIAQEA